MPTTPKIVSATKDAVNNRRCSHSRRVRSNRASSSGNIAKYSTLQKQVNLVRYHRAPEDIQADNHIIAINQRIEAAAAEYSYRLATGR
ncbi:MAG: hypothetical protein HYS86_03385 [Candidatus Chisholmbacteria bacterium]|nr:hypothetical protein [Candidatus Chisholmbacteria bacterium]